MQEKFTLVVADVYEVVNEEVNDTVDFRGGGFRCHGKSRTGRMQLDSLDDARLTISTQALIDRHSPVSLPTTPTSDPDILSCTRLCVRVIAARTKFRKVLICKLHTKQDSPAVLPR
ncbi:hypothetical protein BDV41DRAFT_518348 [Aspergillus transmontanensis]|uniref:Uncharacterized protein n=1 Tax=Aspergillus transmontanensis TaxID=1034304 RepID=A0A5N6WGI1_9EURO|nr:hypothetical protein BDV41DRAFT_518348 [Aspergillus transmontanensis]